MSTADRADNTFIQNDLLQFVQIIGIHGITITLVEGITLLLMFQHAGIGFTELGLIKAVTKLLGSLGYFLVDLLIIFGDLILNQYIRTITLLAVAVINQRVVESIHMSAGLPGCRMHENSRVNTDNILMKQHHALPPILLDVVFQFHTILTIVINRAQTVINIT